MHIYSSPVVIQILIIIMTTQSRGNIMFSSLIMVSRIVVYSLSPILYYLIKAYWTGNQTLPILRGFRYFVPQFSEPKGKNVSAFCNIQLQWKVKIHFWNNTKRYGLIVWKMLSEIKYSWSSLLFVVYALKKLLFKYEGKRTNFLWLVAWAFKRWFVRSHEEVVKNSTNHFISKFLAQFDSYNNVSQLFMINSVGRIYTLFEKSRGRSSRRVGLSFIWWLNVLRY